MALNQCSQTYSRVILLMKMSKMIYQAAAKKLNVVPIAVFVQLRINHFLWSVQMHPKIQSDIKDIFISWHSNNNNKKKL